MLSWVPDSQKYESLVQCAPNLVPVHIAPAHLKNSLAYSTDRNLGTLEPDSTRVVSRPTNWNNIEDEGVPRHLQTTEAYLAG